MTNPKNPTSTLPAIPGKEIGKVDTAWIDLTPTKLVGRPSTYTRPIADEILMRLAGGLGLNTIHKKYPHLPAESTVRTWVMNDVDGFAERYRMAREVQAHVLVEQIIDISDDSSNDTFVDEDGKERVNHDHINRSRLRVDSRKWYASKVIPKIYGDKVEITGKLTLAELVEQSYKPKVEPEK